MSDVKPKRTAREPARGEISPANPVSTGNTPIVPGNCTGGGRPQARLVGAVSVAPEPGTPAPPTVSATPLSIAIGRRSGNDRKRSLGAVEAQATLARGFAAVAVDHRNDRIGRRAAGDAGSRSSRPGPSPKPLKSAPGWPTGSMR